MIENDKESISDDWDDDLIQELNSRSEDFENGTAKMYTWEETKQAAIERAANKTDRL